MFEDKVFKFKNGKVNVCVCVVVCVYVCYIYTEILVVFRQYRARRRELTR